jgi:tRNA/tmRNA/rRNA uracil-C5-methylase (TrmA/RlmC/RlmD family)
MKRDPATGVSSAPKSTRMLAYQESRIVLISCNPLTFNMIL